MPRLLQWYILREFLRVFVITAGVLVTVIAFGAAIKPLSNDSLIGATQAVKYIMLAMVPMLQFALPFAAGFAATMTMHQLTTNNEIVAAAVSGISYRAVLLPLLAVGILLSVFMVGLTQSIIPRFWARMEQTITADLATLFEATIGRGSAFQLGDMQIYADDMQIEHAPPRSDADFRILLGGLAAVETDATGTATLDVTANTAAIDVYQRPSGTHLRLALFDVVAFDDTTGTFTSMPVNRPEGAIAVPSVFKDEPMAKTRGELLEYRINPELHYQVRRAKDDLVRRMADLTRRHVIRDRLMATGSVELIDTAARDGQSTSAPQQSYVVYADAMNNGRLYMLDGSRIRVLHLAGEAVRSEMNALEAFLTHAATSTLRQATFDLRLVDFEISDAESGRANRRSGWVIENVSVSIPESTRWDALTPADLLHHAELMAEDMAAERQLRPAIVELEEEIDEIRWEVKGRLAKRYAMSVTAPLLLLLGGILAMLMKRAQPLTIYLLAFLPSIIDLILISGGEQMIRDGKSTGIVVLWSGNVGLAASCAFAYYRLTRH